MDASYRRDGRGGGGGGGGGGSAPRSVEDIFKDFRARRTAILRALTHGTPAVEPSLSPRNPNPNPDPDSPSPLVLRRRRRGFLRAVRSR